MQIFAYFTPVKSNMNTTTKFYMIILKIKKYDTWTKKTPHFSAFERHAELAASELFRVHWNSPYLNPLD